MLWALWVLSALMGGILVLVGFAAGVVVGRAQAQHDRDEDHRSRRERPQV